VRDSSAWHRRDLENSINAITGEIDELDRGERSFWDVIGVVRKGFRFIPQIAGYYRVRNEALLKSGMGLGEYYYLYAITNYSWLGKRPEDGPDFQLVGEESGRHYSWSRDGDEDEEQVKDVLDRRRYRVMKAVHRFMIPMMERQLDAVGDYDTSWKRDLKKEIDALDDDRDRIPWEDGLPGRISGSFEPYRSRLESSYSRVLNALELQVMN